MLQSMRKMLLTKKITNMSVCNREHVLLILLLLAAGISMAGAKSVKPPSYSMPFNRSNFPAGFIFGAGTAAFQCEGATNMDGKTPSTWDTFVREHPERMADASTGAIADDFYHRYKEDIKLMKVVGLDSLRFSFSWSRLLPTGRVSGGVNPLGVQFYNDLIDELLANVLGTKILCTCIIPYATLYHWDLPQTLQDEYGGWLSPNIVNDFKQYADFCFKTFGDRVKHWITINEPNVISILGYNFGILAPGRCSNSVNNCTEGDSSTEPYIVAHHCLLSHATTVKLYKDKYQPIQNREIGITVVSNWIIPKYQTNTCRNAAYRAMDFLLGWIAHPITFGDYPECMKTSVGNRLPKFTEAESNMLKGSIDFLGLNYYTTLYADETSTPSDTTTVDHSFFSDIRIGLDAEKNGTLIGPPTVVRMIFIYPKGIEELLLYIKKNYNNPPIYITDNGVADNGSFPIEVALKDDTRTKFHRDHLSYLLKSIEAGVKVKGYYLWSLLDDFEANAGYTVRFGIIYVDFKNNLERHLKSSAYWFKKFLLY